MSLPASPACRRRPGPATSKTGPLPPRPPAAGAWRGPPAGRPEPPLPRMPAPPRSAFRCCGSQPEGPPDHRPPRRGRRPGRNRSPPPGPPPVRRLPRSWPPADRRCRPAAGTTVNAPRRHRPVLRPPAPAEWSLPETADYLAPAAPLRPAAGADNTMRRCLPGPLPQGRAPGFAGGTRTGARRCRSPPETVPPLPEGETAVPPAASAPERPPRW